MLPLAVPTHEHDGSPASSLRLSVPLQKLLNAALHDAHDAFRDPHKKATKPLYGRLRAFRVVLNLYGKGNGFLWTNPAVTERSRVDDPT